jgi:hypothetical protein
MATALIPAVSYAQSCTGFTTFSQGRMNVAGYATFRDGATGYGAQLNMRHGTSHFLSLSAGATSYDAPIDETSTDLAAGLGMERKSASGFEWCPMVKVGYTMGPGDPNTLSIAPGLGLAQSLGEMGGFELVPYGTASLIWARTSVSGASNSDTEFGFGLGLGLRLGSGIQFTPSFSKTTATGDDGFFGVNVSIPFGSK